ncbi:23S rRNA pseudouridine(1911/1915/1917) synthase RluD [Rhodocyclaceae bacterium SMB388]
MNPAIESTRVNESAHYSPQGEVDSCHALTIPREFAGLRLDQAMAKLFPSHSRSRLQAWMKASRVKLDGRVREPKFKVSGGEALQVDEPAAKEGGAERAEDIPLQVVFEDAHLLVIDKPVGLVVHPGSGNRSGTLLNALLHHAPELAGVPRAGIVHRLDKDTSGLMVVARTLEAQTDLIRQLQARSVTRHYVALVQGQLTGSGTIDAPIGRHPVSRTRMAVVGSGRRALTHYTVRERFALATLVECRLETGRTHQIRVHMTHIGHPLIGDGTYRARRTGCNPLDAFPRQALHAFRLGLRHPFSGDAMCWEVPIAQDLASLLQFLRSGVVA